MHNFVCQLTFLSYVIVLHDTIKLLLHCITKYRKTNTLYNNYISIFSLLILETPLNYLYFLVES